MKKISICTCCYEKDWNVILSKGFLDEVFRSFSCVFFEKLLIINAPKEKRIISMAERVKTDGSIDQYYFTSDLKDEVLRYFKINNFLYNEKLIIYSKTRKSIPKNIYKFYFSQKGNYRYISPIKKEFDCFNYSIGPLCAIFVSKSDYLLYFTEDCIPNKDNRVDWIEKGIDIMEKNSKYISVRPIDWDLDEEWIDKCESISDFYEAYTFTDRMFLSKLDVLRNIDYSILVDNCYPPYGRTGFESRVFNYMKKNDLRMLVSKNNSFLHEYPKYMENVNNGSCIEE